MPISLDRPIAFIDIESTGLRVGQDRIVELAVIRLSPSEEGAEKDFESVRRFNPGVPIPPEASKVHGITDDKVAAEPPFKARAKSLAKLLEPCDLAGFNIRNFDLPMLLAEFERAKMPFAVKEKRLIDVKMIFHREEPRDLSAAVRFYLGQDHQEAHTALGDTQTTLEVLAAQMEHYPDLPRDLGKLHTYCDEVSPFRTQFDRWFVKMSDGLVFKKGKHKDSALDEVATSHPDYLTWMLSLDDLSPAVKQVVQDALEATGYWS